MLSERDPSQLPWQQLGIDVVFECTGLFTERDKAALHLQAGARKVLVSAPAKGADATIVFGVNDHLLNDSHNIVSNASCTTNCLAPVAKPLAAALSMIPSQTGAAQLWSARTMKWPQERLPLPMKSASTCPSNLL